MKFKSLSNKAVRYGFILTSILLLAGCAKKFLYSNIDWVVIEYLDDYVSLDGEQESLLEERILLLADWHKEEELPIYIDHLKELEALQKEDVTPEALQKNRDQMHEHYQRLVSKAAPDLFSLSMQLDTKQESEFVDSVKERYKERDEKYAGKTEQELREIILENTEEWMEEWLGKLSNQQKVRAKQLSKEVIINSPLWRDYRSSIIQELEYLFENKTNTVVYQQVFMQLLFDPESYYSDQLRENIDRNIELTDQFTLDISQSMSDKQWRHFHGKIREWRELAEELLN
ncbi:DUF6279 family lipoprotein [Vibrio hyugaensis]|uniref:Lipoprotein n=1 Tax=Vibrio hyugaensis TaxID=1534743 RepID=A0ABQ5Y475_9VIBR|nr:DUF6279 family lipoprotein [Vibrio hyugaensis]GLR05751.1 hypothetical protein GCM10007906_33390 [Vibrio hyugaensis]